MATPTRTKPGKRAPKLEFPVTAEMIAEAIPENSAHCMIAEGLKAAFPHARRVSVDLATIRFTDPASGRRYVYLTPRSAQIALLDFDHGTPPEPFTVQAHAAQIVESKPRKSKERTAASGKKKKRARATVIPNTSSGSRTTGGSGTGVPIKVGGNALPMGPLARGAGSNKRGAAVRTGRARRFGLQSMGT